MGIGGSFASLKGHPYFEKYKLDWVKKIPWYFCILFIFKKNRKLINNKF